MELVSGHASQIPVQIMIGVNTRLYRTKLTELLLNDTPKEELTEELQLLLGTLQFWCIEPEDADTTDSVLVSQRASYRPVYDQILQRMTGVEDGDADDEDIAWRKLAEKANASSSSRGLRKQDSQESHVSEQSDVPQSPEEDLKDWDQV